MKLKQIYINESTLIDINTMPIVLAYNEIIYLAYSNCKWKYIPCIIVAVI